MLLLVYYFGSGWKFQRLPLSLPTIMIPEVQANVRILPVFKHIYSNYTFRNQGNNHRVSLWATWALCGQT